MNEGWTLLELMLVVGLVAIVLGYGVPQLADAGRSARVRGVASEVASSLAAARLRAVEHGAAVTVCPSADGLRCTGSTDWARGWIAFDDPHEHEQPAAGVVAAQWVDRRGQRGELWLRTSAGRRSVTFRADGSAAGSNFTMLACAPGSPPVARRLVMSNTGRLRSEAATGVGPACR